jgi:hypothetical protein
MTKKKDTESNVAKWPPVLQRVRDEDDLHYHVDEQADTIDYVENHKSPTVLVGPRPAHPLNVNNETAQRRQTCRVM